MKKVLILTLLISLNLTAGEGCMRGKLVKNPITGKLERETPKEVKPCTATPIIDVTNPSKSKSGVDLLEALLNKEEE